MVYAYGVWALRYMVLEETLHTILLFTSRVSSVPTKYEVKTSSINTSLVSDKKNFKKWLKHTHTIAKEKKKQKKKGKLA